MGTLEDWSGSFISKAKALHWFYYYGSQFESRGFKLVLCHNNERIRPSVPTRSRDK